MPFISSSEVCILLFIHSIRLDPVLDSLGKYAVDFTETFHHGVVRVFLAMTLVPNAKQLDFLLSCFLDVVILDLVYLGFTDAILPNKVLHFSDGHLLSNSRDVFIQVKVCGIWL